MQIFFTFSISFCMSFIGASFNVLTCNSYDLPLVVVAVFLHPISFVVCPLYWPCLPRQGYCAYIDYRV